MTARRWLFTALALVALAVMTAPTLGAATRKKATFKVTIQGTYTQDQSMVHTEKPFPCGVSSVAQPRGAYAGKTTVTFKTKKAVKVTVEKDGTTARFRWKRTNRPWNVGVKATGKTSFTTNEEVPLCPNGSGGTPKEQLTFQPIAIANTDCGTKPLKASGVTVSHFRGALSLDARFLDDLKWPFNCEYTKTGTSFDGGKAKLPIKKLFGKAKKVVTKGGSTKSPTLGPGRAETTKISWKVTLKRVKK